MFDLSNEDRLSQTSHPSTSSLDDPIIQKMLSERYSDLNDPMEQERIYRMMGILKASKKYRRLSAESANLKWTSQSLDSLDMKTDDSSIRNSKETLTKRRLNVSFSENIVYIPPVESPTMMDRIKSRCRKLANLF